MEERVNYHSYDRDNYTLCRHMCKELRDNLLAGFIKNCIHRATHVNERVEYDHRDSYTPCKNMSKA